MADGPAVVKMINDETRALIGVGFTGIEWVTAPWSAPGAQLERDFGVIEAGRDLAGYFLLESDPPHTLVFSIGAVALAHHGRGIGSAIVDEIERRALELTRDVPASEEIIWRMGALADEPMVSALLSARGFREVRRFWAMRVTFDGMPAAPEAIPGVELRTLGPGQEQAVHDCLEEAFRDHWGEALEPLDRFLHRHVQAAEYFDPELWQLAWQDDRVIGALVASPRSDEDDRLGYVDLVGVRRSHRGRGVGKALLLQSFVTFHDRGRQGALLFVDSESATGATRLYERVGMTAQPRFSSWDRPLRPS
ncbi:MAG: mycothiol synthase [Gaiellales bacterium]|nr:mycothiol synthase [Gaiellales bacterium]